MAKITLLVTLSIIWTLAAQAREGFSRETLTAPRAVQESWNSVFMILRNEFAEFDVGSATLIRTKVGPRYTTLYFLSVQHLVDGRCGANQICQPQIEMFQNGNLEMTSRGEHFVNGTQALTSISTIGISTKLDLVLLTARVETGKYQIPKPIEFPKSCDLEIGEPLYSIGFPALYGRKAPQMMPIEDQNLITKRWSRGIFTGYLQSDKVSNSNTRYFTGSSGDAVGGNSGGPLLNKRGEIVGILKSVFTKDVLNEEYLGVERPGALHEQSNSVPCNVLKGFLQGHFAVTP